MISRRQLICSMTVGVAGHVVRARAAALGPLRDPPDEAIAWVCPMHPSYTSVSTGTCPICGMTLIQTRPYDTRDYGLEFRTEPVVVSPGETATLLFRFTKPGTREVVKDFEVVHTKLFHLFIISQDMEHFEHIHPTMAADGTWSIATVLPKAGAYQVYCDVMPRGGAGQFLNAALITANCPGDLVAESARLIPDSEFRKSAQDLTAQLLFQPSEPTSGQYVHLDFLLTDSTSGRPITDLQTYLGQFSHMLLMSEDMRSYVHSHPINLIVEQEDAAQPEYIIAPDSDLDAIRGGPRVTFDALLPKPGRFRAWVQFQRHNQVRTLAYTFTVSPGPAQPVLA